MSWTNWSEFYAELSNTAECLPQLHNYNPIRTKTEIFSMFAFWLTVCSLWRHALQYVMKDVAKQLARKEYGECIMPKFVETLQDKNKLKLLDEVSKIKNFKRLANPKSKNKSMPDAPSTSEIPTATPKTPTATTAAHNHDNCNHDHTGHRYTTPNDYTTYKQDLQKFIDACSTTGVKKFPMKKLSQETGLSVEEIRMYWKYYYTKLQIQEFIDKYLEELWKCLTVGFNALVGCYVMWYQPSFWNSKLLWVEFPQQETFNTTIFYGVGIGYHLHRAVFQFFDHHRKDFVAMTLHHWTTVGLIWLSWQYGLTQCGTIVMFCHDATDCLLSAAKLSAYHHQKLLKEIFFGCFVLHWICVRMYLFAKKVVITSTVDTVPSHCCHWAWYFFIPGLWVLLCLHCYWLALIWGVISKKIWDNQLVDIRSDSDTWEED